ncbi:SCO4402 family protein [Lentzea sp. NPDC055074]
MAELRSPGIRADIVAALDVLVTVTPETVERWPGLTEAVHWLVDDTFWDEGDVAESIGWTLRDMREVVAIRALLVPLLVVLDELGPHEPDPAYLRHPRWPDVRVAAGDARRLLTSST